MKRFHNRYWPYEVLTLFGLAMLALVFIVSPVRADLPQSTIPAQCNMIGNSVACSPTQLGVNALTLPANPSASALSTIIDTRGAKEATLSWSCTAAAMTMTLNIQTYAEDGTTTLALVSPVSAVATATNTLTTIGSESNPATSSGTLATAPAGVVRFPQRALAFSWTDSGATTGTCTARLFLQY
jgi:hypothetical protein